MKKKIKIFSIGVAVLIAMLAMSPALIATPDRPDIPPALQSALEAYPEDNSRDIEMVEDFIEEWDGEDPIPQEIQSTVEYLCEEMEEILGPYVEESNPQEPEQPYEGLTARWISDGKGEYLGDGNDYWGYCRAFNKSYTDFVIECVVFLDYGVMAFMAILWWLLPPIIWFPLAALLAATWGAFVTWLEDDVAPNNHYGMYLTFFKRDPLLWPTPLHNKLDKGLQPSWVWDPSDMYGGDWDQIT